MQTMRRPLMLVVTIWLVVSVGAASAADPGEPLLFTILHTNDEHSTVLPSPLVDHDPRGSNSARGGFARLAGAVAQIRARKHAQNEPVLLASAGDYLGGSAFAWLLFEGRAPEVELFQAIGYDVITIGNHEYDYGSDRFADYLAAAGYPEAAARTAIVATNTVIPDDHPLARRGIQQTHLVTLDNGLAIGFFGLLGRHASDLVPLAPPVTFTDPIAAAERAVTRLREAGADVIVGVTHAGTFEERVYAERVPGIDVIVGGHSHEAHYEPIVHSGTIIVQSGSLLRYLGVLELAFDPASRTVSIRNGATGQPSLMPLDDGVPEHPDIAAQVEDYTHTLNGLVARLTDGRIEDVRTTLAVADFEVPYRPPLQESPMGNFVADAMRAVASEALGVPVDFAFQANGVIRGPITPGTLSQSLGHVTFFDLVDRVGLGFGPDGQPGYPMISVYLTGEEVRRVLEVSLLLSELRGNSFFLQPAGLRATYDPNRAVLARVPFTETPIPTTRAVLHAERLTDNGYVTLARGDTTLYHVVTDHYLAQFLPLVGQLLPRLGLTMKDADGNPVDADQAIIYRDGRELKVWQAVVEYAASQPAGPNGFPRIAERYRVPDGRLEARAATPLLLYPFAGVVLIGGLGAWATIRWRRRHR
jgi:5'-nucleotidase / UDP-sugar diphosphatase